MDVRNDRLIMLCGLVLCKNNMKNVLEKLMDDTYRETNGYVCSIKYNRYSPFYLTEPKEYGEFCIKTNYGEILVFFDMADGKIVKPKPNKYKMKKIDSEYIKNIEMWKIHGCYNICEEERK